MTVEFATTEEEWMAILLQSTPSKVRYEPKIFRVHGKKKMGFRPDFYLEEIDLYIEVGNLTTKRKKMRMMRGHFPQVKVLFLDNKEVNLFQHLSGQTLLAILDECHKETHHRGLSLDERRSIFKRVINRMDK